MPGFHTAGRNRRYDRLASLGETLRATGRAIGRLLDPVAIDSYGASLLDMHWREIGHIELAHNVLGKAEPLDVVELQCTGKSSTRDLSRTAEHYSVAG